MSYGTLSNERWEAMVARLANLFPDFVVEQYEGRHHLDTAPGRTRPSRRRAKATVGPFDELRVGVS